MRGRRDREKRRLLGVGAQGNRRREGKKGDDGKWGSEGKGGGGRGKEGVRVS